MNKTIERTKSQANRIMRNDSIVKDFMAARGAKTAIIAKIAAKHSVAAITVRGILKSHNLIGKNSPIKTA